MSEESKNDLDVLMVSTSFPLNKDSISGVFVKKLAVHLANLTKVTVLTPDGQKNIDEVACGPYGLRSFRYAPKRFQILAHLPGGIPVYLKRYPALFLLLPIFLMSFGMSLVRFGRRTGTIHANWAISGAMAGWLRTLLGGASIVTTLRGEDVKNKPGFLARVLLNRCMQSSDAIVTVSSEMHELLANQYPQHVNKIRTIHNGVDDQLLNHTTQRERYQGLRLISVGSMIPRKNLMVILRAIRVLASQGITCHLSLVGDGPERNNLERFVSENDLSDSVGFTGVIGSGEVGELLKHSNVYVSSSTHEGRPNSVVEAMASGCCCILSDISGHRELFDNNPTPFLFEPSDEHALAELLLGLYKDNNCMMENALKARQFIELNGLTWPACAENYLELFQSCSAVKHATG